MHANEVISRFITSCSHSLRGPLKSIVGLVHLLQNSANCPETERQVFLDLIEKTSTKMEGMLDELEHFLENKKREMITQKINPCEIIKSVLQSQEKAIEQTSLRVSVNADPSLEVYTDPNRFRLIVTNLVANALSFYDPQKTSRELRMEVTAGEGDICLSVADNGIGIEPHLHTKIFQLFFRASERSGGAGIGLYVVKEVVDKMGGSIRVMSTPGIGSRFTVCLPSVSRPVL